MKIKKIANINEQNKDNILNQERGYIYFPLKQQIQKTVEKEGTIRIEPRHIDIFLPKSYRETSQNFSLLNAAISRLDEAIGLIIQNKEKELCKQFDIDKDNLYDQIKELLGKIKMLNKEITKNNKMNIVENYLKHFQKEYLKEKEINISLRNEYSF